MNNNMQYPEKAHLQQNIIAIYYIYYYIHPPNLILSPTGLCLVTNVRVRIPVRHPVRVCVPCAAESKVEGGAVRSGLCASSNSIAIAIATVTQERPSFLHLLGPHRHEHTESKHSAHHIDMASLAYKHLYNI